jgi:hypothetical protein
MRRIDRPVYRHDMRDVSELKRICCVDDRMEPRIPKLVTIFAVLRSILSD